MHYLVSLPNGFLIYQKHLNQLRRLRTKFASTTDARYATPFDSYNKAVDAVKHVVGRMKNIPADVEHYAVLTPAFNNNAAAPYYVSLPNGFLFYERYSAGGVKGRVFSSFDLVGDVRNATPFNTFEEAEAIAKASLRILSKDNRQWFAILSSPREISEQKAA